jgi:hypothetical protein
VLGFLVRMDDGRCFQWVPAGDYWKVFPLDGFAGCAATDSWKHAAAALARKADERPNPGQKPRKRTKTKRRGWSDPETFCDAED